MKILKYLLYALLALIVIGVILGLVGPKTYDISHSRVIAASADRIYPVISSLQRSQEWGPWAHQDTTMVVEYSGTEATVGSSQKWEGKKMGKGEQTITALEPNKSVETALVFYTPFGKMESNSYMTLQDTVGGTKLTWGMKGENNFIGRIMSSLSNAEKNVGPMFDEGLSNIDSLVQASSKTSSAITVTTEQFDGGNYLGIKEQVKISELKDFFSKNFMPVMEGLKKANGQMTTAPSGLYYTWEPDKNMTEVAAAVGVSMDMKAPKGLSIFSIPPSKMLVIHYMGGYSGLGKAHDAMTAFMQENNLTSSAPVIEEYITDPMTEQDSMKWHTKIVYFVH